MSSDANVVNGVERGINILCQVPVSLSGNLVKDATVRNWEIFETGQNTVLRKEYKNIETW